MLKTAKKRQEKLKKTKEKHEKTLQNHKNPRDPSQDQGWFLVCGLTVPKFDHMIEKLGRRILACFPFHLSYLWWHSRTGHAMSLQVHLSQSHIHQKRITIIESVGAGAVVAAGGTLAKWVFLLHTDHPKTPLKNLGLFWGAF